MRIQAHELCSLSRTWGSIASRASSTLRRTTPGATRASAFTAASPEFRGRLCRWCYGFVQSENRHPSVELLDAHHRGVRVTAQMIAADHPAQGASIATTRRGMTALRINRSAYAIAADLVSEGRWRVDPSTGDVFGCAAGHRDEPMRRGYRQTEIRVGQSRVSVYLHRVVWESVHGAIPDGLQLNHIDGVKTNNAIANLELVTQSENNFARPLHRARAVGRWRPQPSRDPHR